MKSQKFYAVRLGKVPGIYNSWDQCKEQTTGFSGAEYKSFKTMEEAEEFMGNMKSPSSKEVVDVEATAYVDGSYDVDTKRFSAGAVIILKEGEVHLSKAYDDMELALMRNVAGEIKAAEMAIQYCMDKGIKSMAIYHDYEGIAKWCNGAWKTNKEGTKAYKSFYDDAVKKIKIIFIKVKGHSGDKYNDLADKLAKQALDIQL